MSCSCNQSYMHCRSSISLSTKMSLLSVSLSLSRSLPISNASGKTARDRKCYPVITTQLR